MRRLPFFGGRVFGSMMLFLAAPGAGARPCFEVFQDWATVVSDEGGFRVSFPTKPEFVTKDVESAAGRLTNHVYSLNEDYLSYSVSWTEFPPAYVRNLGEVRLLNQAKDAFFKRFKGTVIKERIVQLGAAPGRDVQFATEDGPKIRLALYLRGRKLVQALVVSDPDMFEGADAKRFFDSLKWE